MKENNREVAFFGRITAGFTHELKNVLAIIRESSGLMEDILAMPQSAQFPFKERFARAMGTIQGQVQRGIDLSSRLNRFAHYSDHPSAEMELGDVLAQLALLAQRFARLKGVTLRAEENGAACRLRTEPVGLHMALFTGSECCWSLMSSGGEVVFACCDGGDNAVVRITCEGEGLCSPEFGAALGGLEQWGPFQETLAGLGGRLEFPTDRCGFDVILPKSID